MWSWDQDLHQHQGERQKSQALLRLNLDGVLVSFCCCDKAPWPRQLVEGRILLGLLSPERCESVTVAKWHGASRKLSEHILNFKHEEEGANWEWYKGFEICTTREIFPPERPHHPVLPKQHHQLGTGNQMSKCQCLWEPFLFKQPLIALQAMLRAKEHWSMCALVKISRVLPYDFWDIQKEEVSRTEKCIKFLSMGELSLQPNAPLRRPVTGAD